VKTRVKLSRGDENLIISPEIGRKKKKIGDRGFPVISKYRNQGFFVLFSYYFIDTVEYDRYKRLN
jgi:hypothetical protein